MTEYYEISHSSIQSEEVLLTLTGVSFINVCHASITYIYINPSLRSIEATSIQMSKGAPSHMHFVAASIRYT